MVQKQELDQPLFPEIEWEAPQNVKQRGELLIVGGSPHGFASVANSYEYVQQAGIGRATVLMPDATRSAVHGFIDNLEFLPSTPSGSFSKRGLTQLKAMAMDSWGTLLAGEFGRNSETSSLVEGFLMSTTGKIALTKDAVDYVIGSYPRPILNRQNTLLIASFSQLQKLLKNAGVEENVRFEMGLEPLAAYLETLSAEYSLAIITTHHKHFYVACSGRVTLTPHSGDEGSLWQSITAAYATVFWLQHDTKPLEALTTGVYESLNP